MKNYKALSESNTSVHVSCASSVTLKQYLSQLLHCLLSLNLPCGMDGER